MATLYEINQNILNCITTEEGMTVNTETGEVIDLEALEQLELERSEKIRNIALWIKNLKSDAVALDAEEKAFKARKDAAKRKAEQLSKYLADVLNGEKVTGTDFAISWRKSTAVNVLDEKALPPTFLVPQPPKVDKTGISKALKSGETVSGAELIERQNMTIK
nr:MAG TPA: resistance protein [Caudoviricetes sp.]